MRLRRLGPAAHGHLRRGRPADHGAYRLPRPDGRRHPHPADRLLRRHGRLPEDPGQRTQPRGSGAGPGQAGDQRPRPLRPLRELRGPQQRPPARLPRRLRLRLRLHVLHRDLSVRAAGRGAPEGAGALRRHPGGHAAHPGRGAPGHLFALPAHQPQDRPGPAGSHPGAQCRGRDPRLPGRGRDPDRDPRHWRAREAAVAPGLGGTLGGPGGRLRDVRQGPGGLRPGVQQVGEDPRWRAPRGLPLRALHGREQPEDLEVQGQWPDHGGVAALRRAREPRLLHVPVAQVGQAALFRRHPQGDGRVPPAAGRLQPGQRRGQCAGHRQPRLACPHRRTTGGGLAPVLLPAPEPGVGGRRLDQGDPVGLHRPLHARCRRRQPAPAGPPGRQCDPLLRGLREALEAVPGAG